MIRKWWNNLKLTRIKNTVSGGRVMQRILTIASLPYFSDKIQLSCTQTDAIFLNTYTSSVGTMVEKMDEAVEYLQSGNTRFKLGGVPKEISRHSLSAYLVTTDGFVLQPQEADEVVAMSMEKLTTAIQACIDEELSTETALLRKVALVVEDAIAFRVKLKEIELG